MIRTANLTASVSRNAGGLFESVRRLTQSLADTGMDVRVFGTEDEHTTADVGQWYPVKVSAFQIRGPKQFGYSPHMRHMMEDFAPEIVHTHGIWVYTSVLTRNYCHTWNVPYVISAHGMMDPWAIRNSRWKKVIAHYLYEGRHLRGARALRALCESEAAAIRNLGYTNPIAIIPNGIDLPTSYNRPTNSWPLVGGRKVLLFLSRIHPKKGLPNLLRAWAAVEKTEAKTAKSEWVLAIAGWEQGGHEVELKKLASELGLRWSDTRNDTQSTDSTVLFLGPQFNEAKAACYRNCDGFILPSFSEGVPMVVLEAWAHAKPVLMTPECNLPAGFSRNAAIRIDPNVESITRGLIEFFQASNAARQKLADNGLQLVKDKFVWSVLAEEMKGLYEWALGSGPKPRCII